MSLSNNVWRWWPGFSKNGTDSLFDSFVYLFNRYNTPVDYFTMVDLLPHLTLREYELREGGCDQNLLTDANLQAGRLIAPICLLENHAECHFSRSHKMIIDLGRKYVHCLLQHTLILFLRICEFQPHSKVEILRSEVLLKNLILLKACTHFNRSSGNCKFLSKYFDRISD